MGNQTLALICEQAKVAGQAIDITGCRYGLHNRTKQDIGETEYYRFLAGFVQVIKARQVLEVGTHYGGSIMAMARGAEKDARLVTVDITHKNATAFKPYTNIKRIQGDSLAPPTARLVLSCFARPIDLIYIDSLHTKEAVLGNLETYAPLQPRYAVLDDIHISDSMNELWMELQGRYETCDLSDIADRKRVGFGAVRL